MKYNYEKLHEKVPTNIENLIFEIFSKEVEFFKRLEHERHKFALKFGNQARNLFNKIDKYCTK